MLSKEKRLNLKRDFKWVAAGSKVEDQLVKIFYRLGENNFPRLGIEVSSKNFKKAVERNRARRLTSVAFEHLYPNLPQKINMVALPKSGVLRLKSEDLIKDLAKLIKRVKI